MRQSSSGEKDVAAATEIDAEQENTRGANRALHTLQRTSEVPWERSQISWFSDDENIGLHSTSDQDDDTHGDGAVSDHSGHSRCNSGPPVDSLPPLKAKIKHPERQNQIVAAAKAQGLTASLGSFYLQHLSGTTAATEEGNVPLAPLDFQSDQQGRMLIHDLSLSCEFSQEALAWSSSTFSKSSYSSRSAASATTTEAVASDAAPAEPAVVATVGVRERLALIRESHSKEVHAGRSGTGRRHNRWPSGTPGLSPSISRTLSRDASVMHADASAPLRRMRSRRNSESLQYDHQDGGASVARKMQSSMSRGMQRFSSHDSDEPKQRDEIQMPALSRRTHSNNGVLLRMRSTDGVGESVEKNASQKLLPTYARKGAVKEWFGWMICALENELDNLRLFVNVLRKYSAVGPDTAWNVTLSGFFKWFVGFEEVMAAHIDFVDFSLLPFARRHNQSLGVSDGNVQPSDVVDEMHTEIMLKISKIRLAHNLKSRTDVLKQALRNGARLIELLDMALKKQLVTVQQLDRIAEKHLAGLQSAQLKELRTSALKSMSSFGLATFIAPGAADHDGSPTREWAAAIEKMFSPKEYAKRAALVPSAE